MYGGIFVSPRRKQEYCPETNHKQTADWNTKKVTLMILILILLGTGTQNTRLVPNTRTH